MDTLQNIRRWDGVMRRAVVVAAMLLTVAACTPAGSSLHAAGRFVSSAACWRTYEVQPGDTLSGILGTSDMAVIEKVAAKNHLTDVNLIRVGAELAVPCEPDVRVASAPSTSRPSAVVTTPTSPGFQAGSAGAVSAPPSSAVSTTSTMPTSSTAPTTSTVPEGRDVPLPTFHVWYVTPSDVAPSFTDTQIRTSLQTVRDWMAAQTEGRVVFDIVYEGSRSVAAADADLLGDGSTSQFSLLAAPYVDTAGTAVVLYGGTPADPTVCGYGSGGGVAVVYVGPASACGRALAGGGLPFGPAEVTFVHEALHTLALPDAACGTGHVTAGHIADGSDDIMTEGGTPYDRLDPGHDDYYRPDGSPLPCRYLTGDGTLHLP